jgi:hypothetical protein
MEGSDDEPCKFHQKGNAGAVFGSDAFKTWVFDELMLALAAGPKGVKIVGLPLS